MSVKHYAPNGSQELCTNVNVKVTDLDKLLPIKRGSISGVCMPNMVHISSKLWLMFEVYRKKAKVKDRVTDLDTLLFIKDY